MGMYNDPRVVLKPLTSPYRGNDREKRISEAVTFILKRDDKKLAHLIQLLCWLSREYLRSATHSSATMQLSAELVAELYKQGWHDLYFDLLIAKNSEWVCPDKPRIPWPNYAGYVIFINRCYLYLGETRDRSVHFALGLLERYAACALRTHQAIQAGKDPAIEPMEALLVSIMRSAFYYPPLKRFPIKRWVEQLIEAAGRNDLVAREALIDLLSISQAASPNREMDAWESFPDELSPEQEDEIYATIKPEDFLFSYGTSALSIRLHERHNLVLDRLVEEDDRICEEVKREGENTYDWVLTNYDTLLATTNRKMEEIRTRPRRMIRPKKLDRIEIDLLLMRGVGVREIVFDAQGSRFPNVFVDVFARKDTPHQYAYRTTIDRIRTIDTGVFYNSTFQDYDLLKFLLWVIVIDCFHRIVVGDDELCAKKLTSPVGGVSSRRRPRVAVKRAHIRHLPEEQEASQAALARGLDAFGCEFAPGITFVRAFEGDDALVLDAPEAFATYDKDDLLDLI